MSSNMGDKTNTSQGSVFGAESYCGTGMLFRKICPACRGVHGNKSSPKCSRIKQQMYREGKL